MSVGLEALTVGHSDHSVHAFVQLLKRHRVTAIADVRSAPYSRHTPQFNREPLQRSLRQDGIAYSFLGSELGARPDDPSCYDEQGSVCWDVLAASVGYRRGIERVIRGASRYRIALMCAERDPLRCHRTFLVADSLANEGVSVQHILADGTLESHDVLLDRLAENRPRSLFGAGSQRRVARDVEIRKLVFRDPGRATAEEQGVS